MPAMKPAAVAATLSRDWRLPAAAPGPLPITTASATSATARAEAASRMPKPTPTGTLTCARMRGTAAATPEMSRCPAPVTPLSET